MTQYGKIRGAESHARQKITVKNPFDPKWETKHYRVAEILLKGERVSFHEICEQVGWRLSPRTIQLVKAKLDGYGVELDVWRPPGSASMTYQARMKPEQETPANPE